MPAQKKGTKREAEVAAPVAKKSRSDPAVAGVAEALEQASDLSDACRRMLLAGLPKCVVGERHEMQAAVVTMIGQVVSGVQAKYQEAVDAENFKLRDVEASKAELQETLAKAEEVLAGDSKDVEAKTAMLAAAAESAMSANIVLQEKQEAQRTGDAEMVEAQESKAALVKGTDTDLQTIVEGAAEDNSEHYEALLPLLTGLALDQSLMSALPSVCVKKATDRGAFDAMVLDQLRKTLREKIDALSNCIDASLPAAREREAAVAAAHAQLDAATASQQAADEALSAAKAAEASATTAAKVAKDAVAAFEPAYSQATQARDAQAEKLENFRLYNVGSFEIIRDQASAPATTVGGA